MRKCPYCGDSGELYFAIDSRTYLRCCACDLVYPETTKSYDDVVTAYQKDYFERYSVDQIEGSRNILFSHALDLVESRKNRGRLLDVGTGCGFFLIAAQKRGWTVKGVEPSLQSVAVARRQHNLDVFYGTLEEFENDDQFDVITFINVLDHSASPWTEINWANKLLRPGGLLYLRFPNGLMHSQIYRFARKVMLIHKTRKFLVFHQYIFTPKFITRLLKDYKFSKIIIDNSPPSRNDPHGLFRHQNVANYIKGLIHLLAQSTKILSDKKLFCGSSIEVLATKKQHSHIY